jgi:YHS domain-containing protein
LAQGGRGARYDVQVQFQSLAIVSGEGPALKTRFAGEESMTIRTTDTLDEGRVIFREPEADANESKNEAQVTDPVCGMDVDPDDSSAERLDYAGTTYQFCSRDCKEKFAKRPEEFITAAI